MKSMMEWVWKCTRRFHRYSIHDRMYIISVISICSPWLLNHVPHNLSCIPLTIPLVWLSISCWKITGPWWQQYGQGFFLVIITTHKLLINCTYMTESLQRGGGSVGNAALKSWFVDVELRHSINGTLWHGSCELTRSVRCCQAGSSNISLVQVLCMPFAGTLISCKEQHGSTQG